MANIAQAPALPAIKEQLRNKLCVGVSATENALELQFDDGTTFRVEDASGPGNGEWFNVTRISVSGAGDIDW